MKIRPSKLGYLNMCPRFEQNDTEEGEECEAARVGSLIHKALEKDDPSILEDDDQLHQYERCKEFQIGIIGDVVGVEVPVSSDLTKGTVDKVFRNNQDVTLIDWKLGAVEVPDANVNMQGIAYSYCWLFEQPETAQVTMAFVQPRIDKVTFETYKQEDLPKLKRAIEYVIARAEDPNSIPTPNETTCQYCSKRISCPALNELAIAVARSVTGLDLPAITDVTSSELTPVDRSKLHVIASILEAWSKDFKKANSRTVQEEGIEIPGFKLIEQQGRWSVKDHRSLIAMLKESFMDLEGLADCGILTVKTSALFDQLTFIDPNTAKKELIQRLADMSGGSLVQGDPIVYLRKSGKIADKLLTE